jgi:hypothetical protein
MGRVERQQAEEYLKSIALDPAMIDRFGQEEQSGFDRFGGAVGQAAKGLPFIGTFTDEAAAALGAIPAAVVDKVQGGNIGYQGIREATQQRLREQADVFQKQNPVSSAALQIGTGITTGRNLPFLSSSQGGLMGLAKNVGLGAVQGGSAGYAYGFGEGEGTLENRTRLAEDYAKTGAVIGGALPVVLKGAEKTIKGVGGAGGRLAAGVGARSGEQLDEAVNKLRGEADNLYKAVRQQGGALQADEASKLVQEVEKALVGDGKLHPKLHRDTLAALDDLRTLAAQGEVGFEDVDQARQIFGKAIFDNTDTLKGANTDAHKAGVAQQALDRFMESVGGGDLRKAATAKWKQMRQFDTVATAIKKGEGDPVRIKQHLRTLVNNKKRMAGFSPEIRKALKDAAAIGGDEGLYKVLGSFGFDSTGVLRNVMAGGAVGLGGPAGAALAGAGTVARQAEKLVGRGKAENVLRMIEQSAQWADDLAKVGTPKPVVERVQKVVQNAKPEQAVKVLEKLEADPKLDMSKGVIGKIKKAVMGKTSNTQKSVWQMTPDELSDILTGESEFDLMQRYVKSGKKLPQTSDEARKAIITEYGDEARRAVRHGDVNAEFRSLVGNYPIDMAGKNNTDGLKRAVVEAIKRGEKVNAE